MDASVYAELPMLAQEIWATLFQQELEEVTQEPGRDLSARIDLHGAWDGSLFIECDTRLAEQIARRLFGMDRVEAWQARDALGEMANMLGGNFKSMLPSPCELDMPVVTDGRFSSAGRRVAHCLTLAWDASVFRITVVEGRA
jgi:chemotaxis protein CheX